MSIEIRLTRDKGLAKYAIYSGRKVIARFVPFIDPETAREIVGMVEVVPGKRKAPRPSTARTRRAS